MLSKTDALLLFLFLPQTDRISRYDGIHISRNLPKNSPHLFPPTIGMNEGYLVCLYWLSFSMRRRRRSCEIEKWFLVFAFLFQESLEAAEGRQYTAAGRPRQIPPAALLMENSS